MSRERAQRRAARVAQEQAARDRRARQVARRQRRRALLRQVTPRRPDRRTGRLFARRTRAQKAAIAVLTVVALMLIWQAVGSLALRLLLITLLLVALPAFVIITFDRRT